MASPRLRLFAAAAIFLLGLAPSLGAQPVQPQIQDFEDGTTQGWSGSGLATTTPANNGQGGPQDDYLLVVDAPSGTIGGNLVAPDSWHGDWLALARRCGSIEFDVRLFDDDLSGQTVPYAARLYIADVSDAFLNGTTQKLRAVFRASAVPITENDGWQRVRVPLGPSLPLANASGSWQMVNGTDADWPKLLAEVAEGWLPIELGGASERFGYDNFRISAGTGCRCGQWIDRELRCDPEHPGEYVYRFVLRNQTRVPVAGFEIDGLPAGVSVEPSSFQFPGNPLKPNQPRVFEVRVKAAEPGPVAFQVVLRDAEGRELCRFRHQVELPDCSCAQVIASRAPTCFGRPGSSGSPNGTSLTLQNLSGFAVENVTFTTLSPAGATISPAYVDRSTSPIALGGSATFELDLGGVPPGTEVCFRIGFHGDGFEPCCSLGRCVTTADCSLPPVDKNPRTPRDKPVFQLEPDGGDG